MTWRMRIDPIQSRELSMSDHDFSLAIILLFASVLEVRADRHSHVTRRDFSRAQEWATLLSV
jgi:hypothetical protein